MSIIFTFLQLLLHAIDAFSASVVLVLGQVRLITALVDSLKNDYYMHSYIANIGVT